MSILNDHHSNQTLKSLGKTIKQTKNNKTKQKEIKQKQKQKKTKTQTLDVVCYDLYQRETL